MWGARADKPVTHSSINLLPFADFTEIAQTPHRDCPLPKHLTIGNYCWSNIHKRKLLTQLDVQPDPDGQGSFEDLHRVWLSTVASSQILDSSGQPGFGCWGRSLTWEYDKDSLTINTIFCRQNDQKLSTVAISYYLKYRLIWYQAVLFPRVEIPWPNYKKEGSQVRQLTRRGKWIWGIRCFPPLPLRPQAQVLGYNLICKLS